MASAKQFLGENTMSNKKISQTIKSGSKWKIMEVAVRTTPGSGKECLGMRVKGFDGWIRINSTSLMNLSAKWGDDTDDWHGKEVTIHFEDATVMGNLQKTSTIKPV